MLYRLRNLKKTHGVRTILDIDRLEIEEEKVYTLIGPNGAGKTTLLSILAFLDRPTQGLIEFQGKEISFNEKSYGNLRRDVVVVDQYPILFTGPVWKNIDFGLKIRGVAKSQRIEKIEEVLEMVGMQDFYRADAHRLSGGETKRIALARALAIDPKVLLCDEPTANVDTENQEIILSILERCNREKKVSLIFATHYLSQAYRLADHTIILQNGRLSKSRRENIFQARWLEEENGMTTFQVAGNLRLHVRSSGEKVSEQVSFYIDPAKLAVHPPGATERSGDNVWQGTVKKAEQTNSNVTLVVDCGVDLCVVQTLEKYRDRPLTIGEPVEVVMVNEPLIFQ